MDTNNESVQQSPEGTGALPSSGATSTTGGEQQVPSPSPQLLTEERVRQLIAESEAVALERGKVLGRRELQSQQDRNIQEARKRAELAEERNRVLEASFEDLDEDSKRGIELDKLRSETNLYRRREQEEITKQQQEAAVKRVSESLYATLASLGIDPDDKRVDWAVDESDFIAGRNRFDASVAKILNENKKAKEKEMKQLVADEIRKLRIEAGLESHDTSIPTGREESKTLESLSPKERLKERDRLIRAGKK